MAPGRQKRWGFREIAASYSARARTNCPFPPREAESRSSARTICVTRENAANSRSCIRASQDRPRFAILTDAWTAPIFGLRNWNAAFWRRSGSGTPSASKTPMTQSRKPLKRDVRNRWRNPKFSASAFPRPEIASGIRTTVTWPRWAASNRAATSPVRSVEPSSMTRTSNFVAGYSMARIPSRVRRRTVSSFRAGTIRLNRASVDTPSGDVRRWRAYRTAARRTE